MTLLFTELTWPWCIADTMQCTKVIVQLDVQYTTPSLLLLTGYISRYMDSKVGWLILLRPDIFVSGQWGTRLMSLKNAVKDCPRRSLLGHWQSEQNRPTQLSANIEWNVNR